MGRTAKDLLDVLRSWLGYSEYNGKFKLIIDLYNSVYPLPRNYKVQYWDEWCDTTVSAAGIAAGMEDLIGRECGCECHVNIFKDKGIWIEDGTITPKPGDIVLFNWDDAIQPNNGYSDHIAVVESVSGGTITIIEGNSANLSVFRRTIPVGWGYIRGYARPKYGEDSEDGNDELKSVDEIAKEVVAGKWGNDPQRSEDLKAAGYDPEEVRKTVNKMLDYEEAPQEELQEKPESEPEPKSEEDEEIKFYYSVRAKGIGVLGEVCNLEDFAGIRGHAITDIAVRANIGKLKYRVHVIGYGWLPWVTGCDWGDSENGYAGNGNPIDAIQIYYYTPEDFAARHGYQKAQYRVSPLWGEYWSWQYDDETDNGQDGYAGAFGYAMDRFQLF